MKDQMSDTYERTRAFAEEVDERASAYEMRSLAKTGSFPQSRPLQFDAQNAILEDDIRA